MLNLLSLVSKFGIVRFRSASGISSVLHLLVGRSSDSTSWPLNYQLHLLSETARIEEAIKQKNIPELQWAQFYSQSRIKSAEMKEHIKHWKEIHERVIEAIRLVNE